MLRAEGCSQKLRGVPGNILVSEQGPAGQWPSVRQKAAGNMKKMVVETGDIL